MSLRDRLISASDRGGDSRDIFPRFGVMENPFPSAGQSSGHPHLRSAIDDEIEAKIEGFIRDQRSEVIVIEATQGVGKTNLLNYYEEQLAEVIPSIPGFYVIRYLADPEASFDGTLRRLFQELGATHLVKLAQAIETNAEREKIIETARSHEIRIALRKLIGADSEDHRLTTADLFLEWLLGLRVLNRHKDTLGVQFRLDTVESKTAALRDIVLCSSRAGILNGIFLLLDELEKQDGVLSATYVVRYLSAIRAIIDALPNHLFMMIAVTPDALRRYSVALPAFQSRLQNRIALEPLTEPQQAVELAQFYLREAQQRAEVKRGQSARSAEQIISGRDIVKIFQDQLHRASARGDKGLRQREFLHALHLEAETAIRRE